jgi:type II secretory pathway component GspD/PulD (secretin)
VAPSVIVNAESGLIAVRGTSRQHEKVREFLDIVQTASKRQVMIEATVLEVRLSDQYQQGINWQRIASSRLTFGQGTINTNPLSGVTSPGLFTFTYKGTDLAGAVQLLESFGKVQVLSSPKISVLNNQTALLKVVDNNIFFTLKVTPAVTNSSGGIAAPATYESRVETVPVGFVMSVTPHTCSLNLTQVAPHVNTKIVTGTLKKLIRFSCYVLLQIFQERKEIRRMGRARLHTGLSACLHLVQGIHTRFPWPCHRSGRGDSSAS